MTKAKEENITTHEIELKQDIDLTIHSSEDPENTEVMIIPPGDPIAKLPVDIKGFINIIDGSLKGQRFSLDLPYNTFGRNKDNTIVLNDTVVSGHHAVIFFTKSMEWRIKDLGSTNGTLLNGSRVKEFALRNGDKILIGKHLMTFNVVRG